MDRTEQAVDFITKCCSNVGAFKGTADVCAYLKETAVEMAGSKPSILFPYRYIEHVAYAVDMVASNMFTSSPAAIASVYLATRFEFYFRILSGKLNADGTWISQSSQRAAQAAISSNRLAQPRVSNVALTYKIMKLDESRKIVQVCSRLDASLYPTAITVLGGERISDIGDRIQFGRNAAGHGHWGDISAEALFYGLMTAVVYYNKA
jgi:hypothetical protein